jgi:CubicO group peptidase (beta-lactamase class C family)
MTLFPAVGFPSLPAVAADVELHAATERLVEVSLEPLLAEWMSRHEVPGVVVAVVEQGRVLLAKGYGVADLVSQRAIDAERTLLHVAPLAKPITATALLHLEDRGLLDLEADLNGYLPDLRLGTEFSRPATAAHLLTHSAGLDQQLLGRRARRISDLQPLAEYLSRRPPRAIREPGVVSIHSAHGFAIAGLLIEKLTGQSFADFVRERIFRPLEMRRSSFHWTAALEDSLATGYDWDGSVLGPAPRDLFHAAPAAMLVTTAVDAASWMLTILAKGSFAGHRVLSVTGTERLVSRQFSHHPSLPGWSYGLTEDGRFDPAAFVQAGVSSGISSAVVLQPRQQRGLFVAANCAVPLWGLVDAILDTFGDRSPRVGEAFSRSDVVPRPYRLAGIYRSGTIPQGSAAAILSLVHQEHIHDLDGHRFLWRERTFESIGQDLFQDIAGPARVAVRQEDKGRLYLAYPGGVLERLSWWRRSTVQLTLWVLFAAAFLGAASWPAGRMPRRARGLAPQDAFHPRWPFFCAGAAALLYLLFALVLTAGAAWVFAAGIEQLELGPPRFSRLTLGLPLAATPIALLAALGVGLGWLRGYWTPVYRVRLTLLVAWLLLFPPFLASWNLFGFHL